MEAQHRGPDLTSLSALISSALNEWTCNNPAKPGIFEEPSIVAWDSVRPTPSKIDPNDEGMQEVYAFNAGFGMALELAARLIQDPFAKVNDIVDRTANQCEYDLKVSIENRAGRRRRNSNA